jgi:hypothetical protein
VYIGLTLNAVEENYLFPNCIHAAHLVNCSQLRVLGLRRELHRGGAGRGRAGETKNGDAVRREIIEEL